MTARKRDLSTVFEIVSHHHHTQPIVQRYERKPLTPDEQRRILEVLQEQVDQQRWYVVVVLKELVAEIALPIN